MWFHGASIYSDPGAKWYELTVRRFNQGLIALFASVVLLALPAAASADQPACLPSENYYQLQTVRSLVPVGFRAARVFGLQGVDSSVANSLQLSAPPEYLPVPFAPKVLAGSKDVQLGLSVTAPHPGPFVVQGSWTQTLGSSGPCTGTGGVTLTAVNPTPLTITPPKRAAGSSRKKPHYEHLEWTWKCTDNTVAPPLEATLRYQFKNNGRLSKNAKTLTVVAQDPCDGDPGPSVKKKTPQLNLGFGAGGFGANDGAVALKLALRGRLKGRFSVMHLAVVIKQGSSTFVSRPYCANFVNSFNNETRRCGL